MSFLYKGKEIIVGSEGLTMDQVQEAIDTALQNFEGGGGLTEDQVQGLINTALSNVVTPVLEGEY